LPEVSITAADRRAARMEDEIDVQILPLFLDESVDLMRDIGETLRQWRADPTNAEVARVAAARPAHPQGQRADGRRHGLRRTAALDGRPHRPGRAHEVGANRHARRTRNLLRPRGDADRPPAQPRRQRRTGTTQARSAGASVSVETVVEAMPRQSKPQPPKAPQPAAARPGAGAGPPFVPTAQVQLRVRADLVDQLVNEAGEVAIARGRIEGELLALKTSMLDLTENIIRLRKQLREVEIQAESQMQSQQALASERAQEFDPLEFDRFTRFQEVTRMMAESVNDVATVQQNLMRNLDHANAAVAAQARLSRELQQRLMGVRMVPFESIAERLHRVVRQAAKDTGKRANLDIRHGQTELDRSVLDKMGGPLEHMLRNSIAHGLENTDKRSAAGKDPIGQITLSLAQEGNEIVVSISDDGAGLNLEKIRHRAIDRGLLAPDALPDEHTLTQMICSPAFPPPTRSPPWPGAASAWTWCATKPPALAAASKFPRSAARAPPSASICR
jgi:chemosensory pili system protein ChpA (sensor histidine kinase/response regulator)